MLVNDKDTDVEGTLDLKLEARNGNPLATRSSNLRLLEDMAGN